MNTDKVSDKVIEEIKEATDLCDTICCYEDCERCVEKYLNQNLKDIQNAIKYLEENKCNQGQGEDYQEYHNKVLDLAISALKKQIPVNLTLRNSGVCECPNCKTIYTYVEYCNGCGQRLNVHSVR